MDDAYISLIYCCLLYGVLTWYLDHIVPNSFGLSLHPLFFLDPNYWGLTYKQGDHKDDVVTLPMQPDGLAAEEEAGDDDVKAEEKAVRSGDADDGTKAIIINNLQKTVHILLKCFYPILSLFFSFFFNF